MTQFRPGVQHPEAWRQDLNPDPEAGENAGLNGRNSGDSRLTLGDIKEAHEVLSELTKAELRQLPVLRPGERLEQGATYIDLRADDCHEFTATGDMAATDVDWFVPKSEVDHELWNRVIGMRNPARTHRAEQGG